MRLILPILTLFFVGCSLSLSAQTVVDFTNPAATGGVTTYGTHAQVQIGGVWAMWAGDTNGDGNVIFSGGGSDVNPVSTSVYLDPGNASFDPSYIVTGYKLTDTNLSSSTIFSGGGSDINIISTNVYLHPANTSFDPSYIVQQQLP